MKIFISAVLIVVGLINLFPVIGVISAGRLEGLYEISLENPDLIILMRHRAVLFGLLGTLIIVSAFKPALRVMACVAGLVSMLAFIVLVYTEGHYGEAIYKIAVTDIGACVGLMFVVAWHVREPADRR